MKTSTKNTEIKVLESRTEFKNSRKSLHAVYTVAQQLLNSVHLFSDFLNFIILGFLFVFLVFMVLSEY